ncbi:MAG: tyrosine-type recombinase/integrase [Gemmatimonadales bacterium]
MTQQRRRWSYVAGEKGRNRVRAFSHPKTGTLFLEFREDGQKRRMGLGCRDREAAKAKADELALALRTPAKPAAEPLTLDALFDNYIKEVTPTKGERKQYDDQRAANLFKKILGPETRVESLTHRDAARYVRERRRLGNQQTRKKRKKKSGQQGGQEEAKPKPLRNRAIAADLEVIHAALNWAVGAGMINRNPFKGFSINRDEGVRRPIISADEYQQLLGAADQVGPGCRLALVLAHETGHRIGAIRQLRWSDIDLDKATVRWRAENDKIGFEHVTPLTADAVTALKAARKASASIGDAWVFPSPEDAAEPVSRHLVRDWWERLEPAAGIARIPGRGWHALRRQFASELKHTPARDLQELGGWKSYQTIVKCYQRADEQTMRAALASRRKLTFG